MGNGSVPVNFTVPKSSYDPITTPTKIALYSVLLLWSLLGNILVIAVVLTYKRLKTNFNYLIVNMAVSDLFVPLVNLPFEIYSTQYYQGRWVIGGDFGNALCKLAQFFLNISPFVSSLSLVIIAIERLVLIVYPMLKNALFSGKRIASLIAFTWIAATAFDCPNFFLFSITGENGMLKCTPDSPAYKPYAISIFVTTFVIPFVAIVVIYTIMLYNLMKASKNVAKIINKEQMLFRQRRDKKIFYMSISIIVAFFVFWGPFFILLFIYVVLPNSARQDCQALHVAIFVCQYLGFANAAVNPCLYFIFLESYRDGARRIFCKKSNTSDEEGQHEMSRLTRRSTTSTTARKNN